MVVVVVIPEVVVVSNKPMFEWSRPQYLSSWSHDVDHLKSVGQISEITIRKYITSKDFNIASDQIFYYSKFWLDWIRSLELLGRDAHIVIIVCPKLSNKSSWGEQEYVYLVN